MEEGTVSLGTEPGVMKDQKILWLLAQEADYCDPLLLKTLLTPNVCFPHQTGLQSSADTN